MDLTPSSEFVLRYTDEDDYMQVLKEIFEPVEKLFPESARLFHGRYQFSNVPKWPTHSRSHLTTSKTLTRLLKD